MRQKLTQHKETEIIMQEKVNEQVPKGQHLTQYNETKDVNGSL